MTASTPPGSGWFHRIFPVAALVCLAAAAVVMFRSQSTTERLESRVGELTEQVDQLQRTIQLFRFEQHAEAGLGPKALIEQLRFWTPQFENATTPSAQLPAIHENLESVLAAMKATGPEMFDKLEQEFRSSDPVQDATLRKWLLRAMIEVDLAKAKPFLGDTLQSLEFVVTPRTRLYAADLLIGTRDADPEEGAAIDRELAGRILRRILQSETHRGLELMRLPPDLRAKYPDAEKNIVAFEGFFNFVQRYSDSNDADAEQTLLMVLRRRKYHNFLTLQAAALALGKLKSMEAVDDIKTLFEEPPPNYNPMFRNHCLDALAQILGSDGCDYFKKMLRKETRDIIRGKLTELIKTHCGGG